MCIYTHVYISGCVHIQMCALTVCVYRCVGIQMCLYICVYIQLCVIPGVCVVCVYPDVCIQCVYIQMCVGSVCPDVCNVFTVVSVHVQVSEGRDG